MNLKKARQEAIQKAQNYLKIQPVYLDTETTGLHESAEIIEICILDHDGTVLLDDLVRPASRIPAQSTHVHGITNEMVKEAPRWPEIWPSIQAILSKRKVVIYNAAYDLRLLKQSHQQAQMAWQSVGSGAFCIMNLYAQFYGDWDSGKRSFRWQSLERAGQQCRLSLPNSHRAKDDTLLARALLHHIASRKK